MPRLNARLFMAHVHKAETGCWMWMGDTNKGYPTYAGRSLAHRRGYEHFVGLIPVGLELDHLCRTPLCVNPEHLEPVTRAENMRRRNELVTHCKNGHEFTDENTYRRHPSGHRQCRTCNAAAARRYSQRKKAAA